MMPEETEEEQPEEQLQEQPEEDEVAESEDPEEGLSSCFATCSVCFLTSYSNTVCLLGLKRARRASHSTF